MENKTSIKRPESDIIKIKAINQDTYWSKEYGVPLEHLKNMDNNTGIFEKIVDVHVKAQNVSN